MANIIGVLGKARKILGKLTDLLLKGRQAGLWSEKDKIPTKRGPSGP